METPRTITELRRQVRQYLVQNPDRREKVRAQAKIFGRPDLFGWLRLWAACFGEAALTEAVALDVPPGT